MPLDCYHTPRDNSRNLPLKGNLLKEVILYLQHALKAFPKLTEYGKCSWEIFTDNSYLLAERKLS